jgi:hypothetical protein
MAEHLLAVPYITQPTAITCQSTCLKMYGLYLSNRLAMSSVVQGMEIAEVWKEINTSADRPSRNRNSYENMVWWLKKYFPMYEFSVTSTRHTEKAMSYVVEKIDSGFPVMVSTNHEGTSGHIILVVGYSGVEKYQCSNIKFFCHDPYGKFNPQLRSKAYGKRRFEGGSSLLEGGEVGPGKGVVYDYNGIRRIRADKHSNGTYFLISGAT